MYRQHYPDDPGMHNENRSHISNSSFTARHRTPATLGQLVRENLFVVFIGVILNCTAIGLLAWNEGRAVQTTRSFDEGLASVKVLENTDVILEQYQGKLVHVTGLLKTDQSLTDDGYSVSVSAVKLKRVAEMFQWIEHEHVREVQEWERVRKDVTYSYSKLWSPQLIQSSLFHTSMGHHNPGSMPVSSEKFEASAVQIGSFLLSSKLVDQISNYRPVSLQSPSEEKEFALVGNYFYYGRDPVHPEVGDVRVSFEYAGASDVRSTDDSAADIVSVIAKQDKNTLTEFKTAAGQTLELIYIGSYSPQQIFNREKAANMLMTWGLRTLGWFLLFIGFNFLSKILPALIVWLPFGELRTLNEATRNAALSISISLMVIGFSWLVYRPLLSIGLLLASCLPIIIGFTISAVRGMCQGLLVRRRLQPFSFRNQQSNHRSQ